MSRYKISVVQEPPTTQEFDTLAGKSNTARMLSSLVGLGSRHMGLDTMAMDLQIGQAVRTLKQHLNHYHQRPQGNDAYYPVRRQDLKDIARQCDHVIGLVAKRVAGRFDSSNTQFDGLLKLLEGTHRTADAKFNMLLKLELFLTDENIDDMADAMEGKFSRSGKELRSMSPAHMSEYYCGFAFNFQSNSAAFFHFEKWLTLSEDEEQARQEGFPQGAPSFPVFLEAKMKIGFGKEAMFFNEGKGYEEQQSVVRYDGKGKRSKRHVDIMDGLLYKTTFDHAGMLERKLYTTETHNCAFIIDEKEELYIYPHEIGRLHHSTATAGRPVICAGKMLVTDGKIVAINDHSGHYKPLPRHLLTAILMLYPKNVFDPGACLELHPLGESQKPCVASLVRLNAGGWTEQALQTAGMGSYDLDRLRFLFLGEGYEDRERRQLEGVYGPLKPLLTTQRKRGELLPGPQAGPPLREPTRARRHAPVKPTDRPHFG
ncbi:MAG: hypothetical protein V4505_09210 [Pseudomonadota bacterium]